MEERQTGTTPIFLSAIFLSKLGQGKKLFIRPKLRSGTAVPTESGRDRFHPVTLQSLGRTNRRRVRWPLLTWLNCQSLRVDRKTLPLIYKILQRCTQATFKLIRWLRVHWHRPTPLAQALIQLRSLYGRL